jgi:aminoglycoside phosphotransferase (APT) family kinase protein
MLDTSSMPALIERWLRAQGRDETVVDYQLMTGGFSRVMALVVLRRSDGSLEQLVMRGDPPPELQTLSSDRDQEWDVISWLCEQDVVDTARTRWYVDDPAWWGTKAMFLEHLDGRSLQSELEAGADPSAAADGLCTMMAEVGRIDADRTSPRMTRPLDWDSYIDTKLAGWHRIADAHVEAVPTIRYLACWLDRHRPAPAPFRLVHGDLQASNIVVGPGGRWSLIDWEFAHVGDPREDLGYYAAYTQGVPPNLLDVDLAGFLARYCERANLDEEVVNPASLAWWTTVATEAVVSGIHSAIAGVATGKRHGVSASFNSILVTIGYDAFMRSILQMEHLLEGLSR